MLTESTGTNFLDSGGDDGRHWQRNQKRSISDFENEPIVTHHISDYDFNEAGECTSDKIDLTISLYHYMSQVLDIDEVCEAFNRKFKTMTDFESDWNYISTKAEDFLRVRGLTPKFDNVKFNTYNYDNSYSQDVLYTPLENDYILISIHNGADVRGGYTDAKLFKTSGADMYPFNGTDLITGFIGDRAIDNAYNYVTLSDEGEAVTLKKGDKIELDLYL